MRRTPVITFPALALVLALGVTGCSSEPSGRESPTNGSASSSQAPEIDAVPAAGATVQGDGYSYVIPVGWEQQDSALAPGTDTVAADVISTGDFATNVNVLLSPAGAVTPDQVEASASAELEGAGATEVTVLDRVTVAGSESAHVSAALTSGGVSYLIHQYYSTSDGQTYVITFSFPELTADANAVELSESVLATWAWS